MTIVEIIDQIEHRFAKESHGEVAQKQMDYMRNQFLFYGIKSPQRRALQKEYIKEFRLNEVDHDALVKGMWRSSYREVHYFAQELAFLFKKRMEPRDMELWIWMAERNSWWDTIDYIAPKLMGTYFSLYPQDRVKYIKKWIDSGDIWLQRCALLFQLSYKEKTDTEMLSCVILQLKDTREFFINKAIGWALRTYARRNEEWVRVFVKNNTLSVLSEKEALKRLL